MKYSMNFQITLSLLCNRKLIEKKRLNLQNDSGNKSSRTEKIMQTREGRDLTTDKNE